MGCDRWRVFCPPFSPAHNICLDRVSVNRVASPTMKVLRILSPLMIVLRLSAAGMSAEDRQHLTVHLQMTEQWLADEVHGLSPVQLNFRSAPDRWSVRECVAHLA